MKTRNIVISIACITLFVLVDPMPDKVTDKGLDFPRTDPNRGLSLGFDFKRGDYKYAEDTSFIVPEKTKVIEKTHEPYQMDEDDMEDALDYQGH